MKRAAVAVLGCAVVLGVWMCAMGAAATIITDDIEESMPEFTAEDELAGVIYFCSAECRHQPWLPMCRYCVGPQPSCPEFCRWRPWALECRRCRRELPVMAMNEMEGVMYFCPFECSRWPWLPMCRHCVGCPEFCRSRPWELECRRCRREVPAMAMNEMEGVIILCPFACKHQPWLPMCRHCVGSQPSCPEFCRSRPWALECRRCRHELPMMAMNEIEDTTDAEMDAESGAWWGHRFGWGGFGFGVGFPGYGFGFPAYGFGYPFYGYGYPFYGGSGYPGLGWV